MLFAIEGRVGQKKLWGIVGLARSYPRCLIDSACARAITDGVHTQELQTQGGRCTHCHNTCAKRIIQPILPGAV